MKCRPLIDVLVAVAVGVACSCKTPAPPAPPTFGTNNVPDRAYARYVKSATTLDSDTLMAMLSYTSAGASQVRFRNYNEWFRYFDSTLKRIERESRVSENYLKAPTRAELEWMRFYTQRWMSYAVRKRLSMAQAKKSFASVTSTLIFWISDYEYERR